jgi:hypothetical protein
MTRKRACFYIPSGAFVEGHGYVPSLVTENEPGHVPLMGNGPGSAPWYWGMTYEKACEIAEAENAKLGLDPRDVMAIVASSMAAQ